MSKKILMTRFGGIGDMAPMTVAGAQMKKRGWEVTFAVRDDGPKTKISEMFLENPSFDKVLDLRQIGPWQTRCVKTQFGWASVSSLYNDFDLVLDFMNIVENNSTSPVKKNGPAYAWMQSMSSNWRNWYDLHLEWLNINPNDVPDDEKRPIYTLLEGEADKARELVKEAEKLITIQTTASSLSRTWYQGRDLVEKLVKENPKWGIVYWDNDKKSWIYFFGKKARVLNANSFPLRASMALVGISDLFIGADSGYSHVAEGLGVKHIAIYSTVPWWTRAKYYKYQTPIDKGLQNEEFYTFNLGLGDPLRLIEGEKELSEREKEIKKFYEDKVPIEEAAKKLNITPEGIDLELKGILAKMAACERKQSLALSSVSVDEVYDLIKKNV